MADAGIEYEVDPRHVEIMPKQFNIDRCKQVTTASANEEGARKPGNVRAVEEGCFGEQRSSECRALVARANYLALGRPDIAFVVKELARAMSNSDEGVSHGARVVFAGGLKTCVSGWCCSKQSMGQAKTPLV